MVSEEVYAFLRKQNRPFSANDVAQNVSKEFGKSTIQKALDKLVSKKKIIEKPYGKQKIYFVKQEDVKSEDMSTELLKLDQEISALTTNQKKIEEELQTKTNKLNKVQNEMTMEEAKSKKQQLQEEVKALELKVGSLKNNATPISEEEKSQIESSHAKYLKEYKKRKRICTDIINSILEGYPKSKKHLIEDIGLETDEEVGFKLD